GLQSFLRAPISKPGRPLYASTDLLQGFEYHRILRLEFSVHGHVFRHVLTKKNQRVPNVIGLINRRGYLFHHLSFGLRANPRWSFYEYDWHFSPTSKLPFFSDPSPPSFPILISTNSLDESFLQRIRCRGNYQG